MIKSFKVELHPNNKQITSLLKHCGCARFAYNWMLAKIKDEYNEGNKPKISSIDWHKQLVQMKQTDFYWMYEVSKCAPQFTLRNLEVAFKKFFNKKSKFPKFKKKGQRDSFTLDGTIIVSERVIQLPVIGKLRLKEKDYIPIGRPKSATVSRTSDKWFVSVQYEVDDYKSPKYCNKAIGIDLGIKSLAVFSDGTEIKPSTKLKLLERRLKRIQRKLSRQKKGSNGYKKTKVKLSKLHYKISCHRKDILHKTTTLLAKTKQHRVIVIEDLNVKGMVKNHKLAKAISNIGFFEFRRQLEYKCNWYGKELKVTNRFFPSSKTCSNCGQIKDSLKLSERVYRCECGLEIDRDLNAAINLSKLYS